MAYMHPNIDSVGSWTKHEPAANTAAVVTLAAVEDEHHVIDDVLFSYNDTPTGGTITIAEGGTDAVVLSVYNAGAGHIPITDRPYVSAKNTAVVITLAAGGAAVTGKLNVNHR